MDNIQVNNYSASSSSATGKVKSDSALGSTDFMKLLAAQMSNQDVMNPTDNTQFVSQMAQFSSLQAMQSLNQLATSQYSASLSSYSADLVGKNVLVASTDADGKYAEVTGVVDSVSYGSGTYSLKINGKNYALSSVMEVKSHPDSAAFQYAASLVGKKVTVSQKDDSGKDVEDTGVVASCAFASNQASIIVNEKTYDLSAVTKVISDSAAAETGTGSTPTASA